MNDLPPIGTSVRYTGRDARALGATGIVRRHIPHYPDPDRPFLRGPIEKWDIVVEFDRLPPNWPSLRREFIAHIADLEPAPSIRTRYRKQRRVSAARS